MIDSTSTKTCATCQQDKPVADFPTTRNPRGTTYPRTVCKTCTAARRRKRNAAAPEISRAHRQRYRAKSQTSRDLDAFAGKPARRTPHPLPTREQLAAWHAAGCPL